MELGSILSSTVETMFCSIRSMKLSNSAISQNKRGLSAMKEKLSAFLSAMAKGMLSAFVLQFTI